MNRHKPYEPKDFAGKLAKAFLRSPLTVVLGVFLLAIGYLSLMVMPREENPQMVVSGSTVIVALPGASAAEIQKVIVEPLERKLKEVKGVEHIHGRAMDNVGIVNAAFFIGEEKEGSNLKVYDKIMQNSDMFPKGAMNPIIKPLDIDVDIPVVSVAFYANDKNMSKTELYDKVKDIQQQINGLSNVAVTELKGGNRHQFNIEVDLHKLSGYNISMGQIVQAVQSLSYSVPAIKNSTKDNQIVMFGVKNAIETEKDIGNIIVSEYMGSPIYLRQIAEVQGSYDIQNFKSVLISMRDENGTFTPLTDQVTLTVSKLQGTNAVIIAEAVKTELESHKEFLAKNGISYVITRNDGERANEAVNELVFHLLLSIAIIAVLLVFVLGWRESLIVTFTVPAILAITLFVAYLSGQTINRITLFAFLLSLGLLVDAAIIVIENIHRHYHSIESQHENVDDLMIKATDEIGPPTNIATLAIIMTMVPMAFVGQMMGQFMKPIPANVPIALIASLFVAYIFTPYLAVRMLKKPDHTKKGGH
ncbi:MAG: efflux RND transporter permease subunit [Epsilonproteobacteria bacterium]|nr:efflux RND transporter permease subunit [Campylobacterota bacterium]OIO14533.1 MAG: multidrug transporter AcrB [Helicobacteraceae bacterium CG1_02_36_14]PIP10632.1 MAG: multidrug transporter AcrB [Sulfurimonas sp. CG23_combo_of_CG06-09_8_20_14_all_36_33]PIS25605.1 MAG: AcrB/AcrD/AcrF family protein [Sulfurimonas sp. CG08_land_8_20_14_0_20_36_33]PIU34912.1 MAG: AcrB/AcrD/AcrF family protein [Sulfurimonas sp. CG07_land_8_20_14_0_80_36_56]PIV04625.1 MAG: AcrB/AcrD/AcrF family protein [Sulfurim